MYLYEYIWEQLFNKILKAFNQYFKNLNKSWDFILYY